MWTLAGLPHGALWQGSDEEGLSGLGAHTELFVDHAVLQGRPEITRGQEGFLEVVRQAELWISK